MLILRLIKKRYPNLNNDFLKNLEPIPNNSRAVDILLALTNGNNPVEGQKLPSDHFLLNPKIQGALKIALEALT